MASLVQDKQSRLWSVRFRIVVDNKESNKRLSGFKQKKEAQAAYVDFMSTYVAQPKIQERYNVDYHFNVLLAKYLTTNAFETSDATQYEKKTVFNLHIIQFFDNIDVRKITKTMLYDFQEYLWGKKITDTDKEYAYKTLVKIRGFLYNFLEWCDYKYDINNQLSKVKVPKNNQPLKEMIFWEDSEILYFFNTAFKEEENSEIDYDFNMLWKTFFMVMFYSGTRISECLAISDRDIIKDKKIKVVKSITRKTNDGSLYKITATKNYKNRTVPIPQILQQQLHLYLQWKKDNKISPKFLFGGDCPLSNSTLRRRFDVLLEKTNLTITNDKLLKRIRVHDIRHSYVSMLTHVNVTTKTVAKLIGDTEAQVIKTYSHFYCNDEYQAIDKLDMNLDLIASM